MNHYFNVEVAINYGINEAVFLENLAYWIFTNRANKKHFYEGRYWTYNSHKAFKTIFPYWSEKTLRTTIKSCLDKDLIIKGNFNRSAYDQTLWYSLSDNGQKMFKFQTSDCEKWHIDVPKTANEEGCGLQGTKRYGTLDNTDLPKTANLFAENGEPIPLINTDNKQKIKDKKNAQHKKRVAFDPEKIDLPNWLQKELWIDFVQHRILIKKPLTELAAKKTINLLTKMKEGGQDIEVVINMSIANGWQGLFEIKSQRSSYGKDSKYHGKNGKFDSTQYLLDSIRLDESKESNPLSESSLPFQDCQYLQYDGTSGDCY